MNLRLFNNSSFARHLKILHRLPGRLRLSVPALARLKNGCGDYSRSAETLLTRLPGMHGVSINHVSASVLLEYDASSVTETDVLGWIERLASAGIERYEQVKTCANTHIKMHCLQATIRDEIRRIRTGYADRQ